MMPDMFDMHSLSARMRELRFDRGLTQQELAFRAQLAIRTVARMEAGEGNPSLATLEAVAQGLGVSVSELLGNGDPVGRAS